MGPDTLDVLCATAGYCLRSVTIMRNFKGELVHIRFNNACILYSIYSDNFDVLGVCSSWLCDGHCILDI